MKKLFPVAVFVLAIIIFFASAAFAEKTYIVKQGDSLWKIHREFGVSVKRLLQANPDCAKHPKHWVFIGQTIKLDADLTKITQLQIGQLPTAATGFFYSNKYSDLIEKARLDNSFKKNPATAQNNEDAAGFRIETQRLGNMSRQKKAYNHEIVTKPIAEQQPVGQKRNCAKIIIPTSAVSFDSIAPSVGLLSLIILSLFVLPRFLQSRENRKGMLVYQSHDRQLANLIQKRWTKLHRLMVKIDNIGVVLVIQEEKNGFTIPLENNKSTYATLAEAKRNLPRVIFDKGNKAVAEILEKRFQLVLFRKDDQWKIPLVLDEELRLVLQASSGTKKFSSAADFVEYLRRMADKEKDWFDNLKRVRIMQKTVV